MATAIIGLLSNALSGLGGFFTWLGQKTALKNTLEMKSADVAKKDQVAQDQINETISKRDEKATRDGLA